MFEDLDKNLEKFFWLGSGAYSIITGMQQEKETTKYLLLALGGYSIFRGLKTQPNPEDEAGAGQNPVPPGYVNTGWVNAFVVQLHDNLNSWTYGFGSGQQRCVDLEVLANVDDATFVTIHNRYYELYSVTIGNDIRSLNTTGCPSDMTPEITIRQRQLSLGII
jgi:hypothetical protein